MLLIKALTVRSGEKTILDSLNLRFLPYKIHVVIGPGGSGKTTLCVLIKKILFDYYISLNSIISEEELNDPSISTLYVKGKVKSSFSSIIYMEQKFKLNNFSLFHNLFLLGQIPEDSLKKIWSDKYLEVFDILKLNFNLPIKKLPKYIERLAYLTLVLSLNPNLLILDEPEVNTDIYMNYMSEKLLEEKNNRTIICITHNISFAKEIADNIILLRYGRVIHKSNVENFWNSKNEFVQSVIKMGC
ncbi:MAG: ATP-binding cassette domain-containing protein [Cyanobacteriota bacterium]